MDEGRYIAATLLAIAFAASLFMMWTIAFRLRSHMASIGYKFIFTAKIFFAIQTGSGFYLVLWPLKNRLLWVTIGWFVVTSLGILSSALGFYLYSRDVQVVLESDNYTAPLPAIPCPPNCPDENHHHSSPPHKKED